MPSSPIIEAVRRYVFELGDAQYDRDGREIADLTPLLNLSEKSEVPFFTLQSWLEKPHRVSAYIPFPVADRIVCGMGGGVMWWRSEMPEHYYGVSLSWGFCECPGCTNFFQRVTTKTREKLYCSKECRMSARHQRIGRTTRPVKRHRGDMAEATKCRNGHDRTPDNIFVRKNGKRECLTCKRESNNEGYHRRRKLVSS